MKALMLALAAISALSTAADARPDRSDYDNQRANAQSIADSRR